jgi:hypothetical protein
VGLDQPPDITDLLTEKNNRRRRLVAYSYLLARPRSTWKRWSTASSILRTSHSGSTGESRRSAESLQTSHQVQLSIFEY